MALNPLKSLRGKGKKTARARGLEHMVEQDEFNEISLHLASSMSERTARRIIESSCEAGFIERTDDNWTLTDEGRQRIQEIMSGIRFLLGEHIEQEYGAGVNSFGMAKQTIASSGWFGIEDPDQVPEMAASIEGTPNQAARLINALNEENNDLRDIPDDYDIGRSEV